MLVDREQCLGHAADDGFEAATQLRFVGRRLTQFGRHAADRFGHRIERVGQHAELVLRIQRGGRVEITALDLPRGHRESPQPGTDPLADDRREHERDERRDQRDDEQQSEQVVARPGDEARRNGNDHGGDRRLRWDDRTPDEESTADVGVRVGRAVERPPAHIERGCERRLISGAREHGLTGGDREPVADDLRCCRT